MKVGDQFRLIYKTNQFTIGKCYILCSISWSKAYRQHQYWFVGDNGMRYFVTEELFCKMFKSIRQERREKLEKINGIK